jgi:predicted transposase/invertase (TIGR01784 family)
MNLDDTLWKGILENTFDDFLRFFFNDADKFFNLEKGFQFLDKELEEIFPLLDAAHPKFVDKLVKVFTQNGSDEWILVHVEVQGYTDPNFAFRMYTYFYRILDRYKKQVTAIAIFTDSNKQFRPATYHYDFLGTTNTFSYNIYKVIDQNESALAISPNPFAIVILTVLVALKSRNLEDKEIFDLKKDVMRNLLKHQVPEKKIRSMMNFLKFYIRFADPVFNTKFEETIFTDTENKTIMGIEEMIIERFKREGREEGRQEGRQEMREEVKTEVVKNLLAADKFTIAEIANFASVTETFVLRVKNAH